MPGAEHGEDHRSERTAAGPRSGPRASGRRAAPPSFAGATALAAELAGVVRGEVRFDSGSRALYSTDASNYRQLPIGVVLPRDAEDVAAALAACRRHGAPVLARRGGGSPA